MQTGLEKAARSAFSKPVRGGQSIEIIGVNVGGTSSTVVRGDESGTIAELRRFPTRGTRGQDALYADIASAVQGIRTTATSAVGVAIGGPLDARRGVVLGAVHLPFKNFPLQDRLAADLGLPARVHHDAAACALAEWRWGAAAGVDALAYLTCGTGFGVGLVFGGRAHYGSSGHSPEIGHVRYRDDGPDIFGKPGCFEGYGSANALALLARTRDPEGLGRLQPAEISERALAGDASAAQILAENERAAGAACALLADLLVVDVIVLGSLSRYLGPPWLDAVQRTFAREALAANVRHCRLLAAMDGVQERSGLAAALGAGR